MAFVYGDRVKESSASIGTGPMSLDGAASGFQTFEDGIGEGNETYYVIINTDDTWEIGVGTYTGNTLVRDTVLASTNAGALVSFGSGTKTVGGTVSKEFYDQSLTIGTHVGVDHTGVPGVPAPEQFDSAAHDATDHSVIPLGLLNLASHEAINHILPPLSLLDSPTHAILDHTGVSGVNSFDEAQHSLVDHTGILGIPAPEAFTAAVHAMTNHAGLPGVGGVPSVDDAAQVVFNSAASVNNMSLGLPAGTWAVFAYAAWRTRYLDPGDSHLRIDSVIVSTIPEAPFDTDGWQWYCHFGFRLGMPGSTSVNIDFDDTSNGAVNKSQQVFAFAVRTA